MTLDDPDVVRRDYADETRFTIRQSTWRWATGPDVHALIIEALRDAPVSRVLEVGPGKGELAERIAHEVGVDVTAVDQSERMVELTKARGVRAAVGDVQDLPFAAESFDACVAAWMLYHVPDLDRGLAELARVLRPGGRLVAVTNSEQNLTELWSLVGEPRWSSSFTAENAGAALERHFARVERRDVHGTVSIPNYEAAHRHIGASPVRAHLADALLRFEGPLVATRAIAIFVAHKA